MTAFYQDRKEAVMVSSRERRIVGSRSVGADGIICFYYLSPRRVLTEGVWGGWWESVDQWLVISATWSFHTAGMSCEPALSTPISAAVMWAGEHCH